MLKTYREELKKVGRTIREQLWKCLILVGRALFEPPCLSSSGRTHDGPETNRVLDAESTQVLDEDSKSDGGWSWAASAGSSSFTEEYEVSSWASDAAELGSCTDHEYEVSSFASEEDECGSWSSDED